MEQDTVAVWSETPIADARSAAKNDPDACRQACLDNSDCYRANMGSNWCYLYNDTPSTARGWFATGGGATSWVKSCGGNAGKIIHELGLGFIVLLKKDTPPPFKKKGRLLTLYFGKVPKKWFQKLS